jgi:SAM-dependent methyltransferase
MIDYARVSEMVRYVKEKRLWADWRNGTRCWEYPWVLENGGFERGMKCLDAGCGRSPLPIYLHQIGCEAHGLDYLQGEMCNYPDTYGLAPDWVKRWTGKVHYHHGTMLAAPFPDNSFDRITCISVLEHILAPDQPHAHYPCLEELRRILKPGGLLIVTVDYFVNPDVTPGYDYRDDIAFVAMPPFRPNSRLWTREEITMDEDAFFIPPHMYLEMGYGQGFNRKIYHRLTSVGYILQKPVS